MSRESKITETPNQREVRLIGLRPIIERVARTVHNKMDARHRSILERGDFEQHLYLWATVRPGMSAEHKQAYVYLTREANSLKIAYRNQRGPLLSSVDSDGQVMFAYTVDEVKDFLNGDWDMLPITILKALDSHRMPPQFVAALQSRYRDGIPVGPCGPVANRTSAALNRLMEILNLSSLTSDD